MFHPKSNITAEDGDWSIVTSNDAAAPTTPITISSLRYMSRDELADRLLQQQQQQQQQQQSPQHDAAQRSAPDPRSTAAPGPPVAPAPALVVVDVRDDDYVGGHVRGGVRAPSG